MPFDPTILVSLISLFPIALLVGLVCATVVCVVALLRGHRTDTVAVVRALAELVGTFTRYRRKRQ
ncbi:hypothetical protein OHA91_39710 (plasmid) [Streptomyces erythrochromogenes]|uniref:Transmembrane protein n=1 Tax=Streptomyces erythrochromogenes TaxID=285574 RepID=A0ABZ1QPC5_9ACTN|nr:hypothetical protein [Streptomyces erythrochromogenes]